MSGTVDWIAAAADSDVIGQGRNITREGRVNTGDLPAPAFGDETFATKGTNRQERNQNPDPSTGSGQAFWQNRPEMGHPGSERVRERDQSQTGDSDEAGFIESSSEEATGVSRPSWEEERERTIYRGRTVNMLRRYMRYSHETGRLPSLLGREFFRAKVTAYVVVTFEDRVIFVHDMETCLNKLDEFSRQLIARHILQEHDQEATARLLGCSERTVRTYVPIALDVLSEILLDLGLMERIAPKQAKSCQGGKTDENLVSDCVTSKNKS